MPDDEKSLGEKITRSTARGCCSRPWSLYHVWSARIFAITGKPWAICCIKGRSTEKMILPLGFAPILFSLIESLTMSCIVTGISTFSPLSFSEDFNASWMSSWGKSLIVTYPVLLIVFPMAWKIVSVCVLPPDLQNLRPHKWTSSYPFTLLSGLPSHIID